jgi:hypothetical protein
MKSISTDQIASFAHESSEDSGRWDAWMREHAGLELEVTGEAYNGSEIVGLGPEQCFALVPQNYPPLYGSGWGIVVVFFTPTEEFEASSVAKGKVISARGILRSDPTHPFPLGLMAIECYHRPAA